MHPASRRDPHSPSRSLTLHRLVRAAVAVLAPLALALGLVGAIAGLARSQTTPVFSTDFESGVPAEFSAPGATLVPVQGYAGLGVAGDPFGGDFLRYAAPTILDTRLVLRGLPPHDRISIGFLLGLIDSWDGTELMCVSVDGQLRFSHWFQLATGDASSYVAPPGALLSSGTELGFSVGGWYSRDRAYDLSVDSTFIDLPHTADSLTVRWYLDAVSGGAAANWQGGADESWALDNVRVSVTSTTADVAPGKPALALALQAPHPHPAVNGRLQVGFSLPSAAPASLELIDVSGRRLAAREVGGLGAGRHTIELSAGARLAPGVYLVRLTQAASTRVLRVVVL